MVSRITIRGFAGEVPKVPPHYLPDMNASSCVGAALDQGNLTAFKTTANRAELSEPADAIYLHGAEWLSWDSDADAVPGPVATDRLYITRDGNPPAMRVDGVERPLAIPDPFVRPTVSVTGTPDDDIAVAVLYAWSWVTSLGEESGLSPASESILWSPGHNVTVGGMPSTVPVSGRLITGKKIYRSETAASGETEFFFVAQIPAANVSYVHNLAVSPIQEAALNRHFGPPPDNLIGLTAMPNGMMAAFRGKELWFCEPYQPHTWPSQYMLTTNDFIVGLAAFGTSLAVLTTGNPYVVQGMHPEQMAMEKIEQPFPCIAKRGIVDMGYAAIYPSPEGLVQINTSGAQLISASLWTPKQWRALQPVNIRAARFGTRYAFLHLPAGATDRQLAFVDTSGAQPFLVRTAETGLDLFNNERQGTLLVLDNDGTTIKEFDPARDSRDPYIWRSKPFRMEPQSFGIAQVDTDQIGPSTVTCIIHADGQELHRSSVKDEPFRLPSGKFKEWQIELTGSASVMQVRMARTIGELDD